MEVNTDFKTRGVASPTPAKPAAAAKKPAESASFTQSDAIEKALKNTLDSRGDQIERARGLISDVTYPPLETIRKISKLLAIKINSDNG